MWPNHAHVWHTQAPSDRRKSGSGHTVFSFCFCAWHAFSCPHVALFALGYVCLGGRRSRPAGSPGDMFQALKSEFRWQSNTSRGAPSNRRKAEYWSWSCQGDFLIACWRFFHVFLRLHYFAISCLNLSNLALWTSKRVGLITRFHVFLRTHFWTHR